MTGTHGAMIRSMHYSHIAIENKAPMYIFPEGKRLVNGRVNQPKPGVFHFAAGYGASFVPVYLKGFLKLYSRSNPGFHFCRLGAEVLILIPVNNIKDAMDQWFNVMKENNDEEFQIG